MNVLRSCALKIIILVGRYAAHTLERNRACSLVAFYNVYAEHNLLANINVYSVVGEHIADFVKLPFHICLVVLVGIKQQLRRNNMVAFCHIEYRYQVVRAQRVYCVCGDNYKQRSEHKNYYH